MRHHPESRREAEAAVIADIRREWPEATEEQAIAAAQAAPSRDDLIASAPTPYLRAAYRRVLG